MRISLAALGCVWLAAWTVAAADEAPVLKLETLASPVVTSRLFSSGLAPNTRGGWSFVGQFMNLSNTDKPMHKADLGGGHSYLVYNDLVQRPEAEWVIADLQAGTAKVVRWPGFSSLAWNALAENGRLFFPVDYAQIYYYDPAEDTVKPLGRVQNDKAAVRTFYHFYRGPDGMIYGTSVSNNGLATLIRINPDSLEYKLYEKIGLPGRRAALTYAYTLAVDPPWMYVAVGQGNWELFAVNADTGEKKCLVDVTGDGSRIEVPQHEDFCTAQVVAGKKDGGAKTRYWLVNGAATAMTPGAQPPGLPMTERKCKHVEWKQTRPLDISHPPELDPARPADVDRQLHGEIFWRPEASGDYRAVPFTLQNAEAVRIESLLALPGGSLLGNTFEYNGFFRYQPATKQVDYFGKHGPSQVQSLVYEGKVWFDGYPNVNLWVYDPAQPWTSRYHNPPEAKTNPQLIGYFGATCTEAHHCRFLLAPGNGRIYVCGDRERWSTGTGIGYYDIATGKKFGLGTANKEIWPAGCIAIPKAGRIILSGDTHGKGTASLIVYDMDLNEVERLPLKAGLTSTGALFDYGADGKFIGRFQEAKDGPWTLYRYDLAGKRIEKSAPLASPVHFFRRPVDGTFWTEDADGLLARLDPETLTITPAGRLERNIAHPTWQGKELYGCRGGELFRVVGVP